MKKLVSIHDVCPETLGETCDLLRRIEQRRPMPVTLLVIPGRSWDARSLAELTALVQHGYTLAAHGWHHRVERYGGWKHRLHAALISRNVAEHLALDEEGVLELMEDSFSWFVEKGFPSPRLYVPPAWALGPVRRSRLREVPFEQVEVLRGMLETSTGRLIPLPLCGYEVDRPWSVPPVRAWNAWNRRRARNEGTLRIAIHPSDLSFALRRDLLDDLFDDRGATAEVGSPAAIGP